MFYLVSRFVYQALIFSVDLTVNRRAEQVLHGWHLNEFQLDNLQDVMMKAIWNNVILAESDNTMVVENNHYFPPDTLKMEYFISSETTSHCPWKGDAKYYSIVVNEDKNEDAAWYYSDPKDAAKEIKNHVAFWQGVKIE